jgi:hypothetical protein
MSGNQSQRLAMIISDLIGRPQWWYCTAAQSFMEENAAYAVNEPKAGIHHIA